MANLFFEEQNAQASRATMAGDGASRLGFNDFCKGLEFGDKHTHLLHDVSGDIGVGDKDAIMLDVIPTLKATLDIVCDRLFHTATVLFAHSHLAAPYFNAGL